MVLDTLVFVIVVDVVCEKSRKVGSAVTDEVTW